MCQYQTLYHDDRNGYIVRCTECEKIQVGYGNLILTFDREDFTEFSRWLKRLKDDHHPSCNESVRSIVIPTPCEGIKLLMSVKELRNFHEMLEMADTELQSIELINLFNEKL